MLTVRSESLELYRRGYDLILEDPDRSRITPAVACIDTQSHIVRVMPSRASEEHLLTVTHENSDTDKTSRSAGLLKSITRVLYNEGADIWQMSNQIISLGGNADRSSIQFWVSDASTDKRLRRKFQERINTAMLRNDDFPHGTTLRDWNMRRLGASEVFVSTKTDWLMHSRGKDLRPLIELSLEHRGFRMRTSPDNHAEHAGGPLIDSTSAIRASDGLLQIVPQSVAEGGVPTSGLEWLTFELGFAHAANIPFVIVVDSRRSDEVNSWLAAYRGVLGDRLLHTFDGTGSTEGIMSAIDQAIHRLDQAMCNRASSA